MTFIRRANFRNIKTKARSIFSLTSAISLSSLIIDSYKIPITEIAQKLLDTYDTILANTIGKIVILLNKILIFLNYEIIVPDSWRHLFIWLAFYFSTFWYQPNDHIRHAKIIAISLAALSILIAFFWSIYISIIFPNPQSIGEVILASFLLMIAPYLYEIIQILFRSHFDLAFENEKYNKNESWTDYFARQHLVAIKVFVTLGASSTIFFLLCHTYGVEPRISLLLLIFCISMTLNHYGLAIKDTKARAKQVINLTKRKSEIFFETGNAIMATNFAIQIFIIFMITVLAYHSP